MTQAGNPAKWFQNRPYQDAAIRAAEREFERGIKSTCLVMATGTGKTVVFSQIAQNFIRRLQKPVLVLAHRTELLTQAYETLQQLGLKPALEKAEQKANDVRDFNAVVASVQTLAQPARFTDFEPDDFSLIVTDEAHHAVSATYRGIYDYFKPAKHLGVTATPVRFDKIGLKNIFQSVAFQYSIQEGIKDKYLCDVAGKQVTVEGLTLESLKIVSGDFAEAEITEMLMQENILQRMVLPTLEHAKKRQTICFTNSVEHAHAVARSFNRVAGKEIAIAVDGGMSDRIRAQRIQLFRENEIQFIVNCGVLTEGFDYPPTACIALFRPTRSLGLLAQMIGRGTRTAEGKTDCLVLDFVGINNTVRTMNVLDVLDGTVLTDAENRAAQKYLSNGDSAVTALEKAKTEIAKLEQLQIKWKALSTSNAFDVMKMLALPSAKGLYGGNLATLAQRGLLENAGIYCPPTLEKGEAMRLISEIIRRGKMGLATFKQMKELRRLGYKRSDLEQLSLLEASEKIGELKSYRKAA